jgi:hypothetical protein
VTGSGVVATVATLPALWSLWLRGASGPNDERERAFDALFGKPDYDRSEATR